MTDRDQLYLQLTNTLAALGDEAARAMQLQLAASPDDTTRKRVMEARLRQGDDRAEVLSAGLADPHAPVREKALKLAVEFPEPRVLPGLAACLADRSEPLHALASQAVLACGCTSAEQLEPVLRQVGHSDLQVRIRALQALAYRQPAPAVMDRLLAALDTGDTPTRIWVNRTLAHCTDRERLAWEFRARLDNPERDLALSALWGLASLGQAASEPELLRFLADPDPRFVEAAVFGLLRAGLDAHRQRLHEMWEALGAPAPLK